jgi:hypothetical protein
METSSFFVVLLFVLLVVLLFWVVLLTEEEAFFSSFDSAVVDETERVEGVVVRETDAVAVCVGCVKAFFVVVVELDCVREVIKGRMQTFQSKENGRK